MNRKHIEMTQLTISLLVLQSVIAAVVFALLAPEDVAILGWALIGFVVVSCFARPFRGAGAVATVMAILVLLGAQVNRLISATNVGLELSSSALQANYLPALPNYLPLAFAGGLSLAVAGWLGNAVAHQLLLTQSRMEQGSTLIQELTLHDDLTGTLKPVYADAKLSEEIERARRYNRTVSVVMFGADNWPSAANDRDREELASVLRIAGEVFTKNLRHVDTVSYREESRFIAILPETSLSGAQAVAERLCRAVTSRVETKFRAGVAEFPADAASKTELLSEAAAALKFARNADITVASRGLLV